MLVKLTTSTGGGELRSFPKPAAKRLIKLSLARELTPEELEVYNTNLKKLAEALKASIKKAEKEQVEKEITEIKELLTANGVEFNEKLGIKKLTALKTKLEKEQTKAKK